LAPWQRRGLRGDLLALCSFPRRAQGEGGAELFSWGQETGEWFKAAPRGFGLDIRKHFFTERVVRPWNRLTREGVDGPSLSVFKKHLDNALSSML